MTNNTWNNGTADGKWSTNGNWSGGHSPTSGEIAVFDGTSATACSIDPTSPFTIAGITFATGYGVHTVTGNTQLNITITGDLVRVANNGIIVFGNGAVWNIQGSIDPNTVGSGGVDNYSGATVNLSGSGKVIGLISSVAASPYGVVNLLLGASYSEDNGEIGGVEFHNYGTLTATAELNINRASLVAAKIYNHSTGVISGAGQIVFTFNAQWVLQDGTESIGMGLIDMQPTMSLIPGTYNLNTFYRQGGGSQIFSFTAGTYNITSAGIGVFDDGFSGSALTYDNTAGAIINMAGSFDLTSALGGILLWLPGGIIKFNKSGSTTINSNGLNLDNIVVSNGCTLQLSADLNCLSMTVNSGGTFDLNGHNITTVNDFIVQAGGALNNTGLNNKTITYGGSLYLVGTGGTPLSIQPATAVTFTEPNDGNPLVTANASFCTFKNVTCTRKTLQADNSTNSGGNSGINFSPTANRLVTSFISRIPVTLSAGAHTIEALMAGSSITVLLDNVTQIPSVNISQNQTSQLQGIYDYYDGTYQRMLLDNLNMPNTSQTLVPPTGLAVTIFGIATWNFVVGATQYTLRRSPTGAGTWTTIYTGNALTFADTVGPLAGTTIDYEVASINGAGTGAYSSIVTVVYPAAVTPITYNPKFWYQPGMGYWQDAARTTPATSNGQPILAWDDQSGNGWVVKQSGASTLGGVYAANAKNGITAVDFTVNVTAQRLYNTSFNGFGTVTSASIFCVCQFSGTLSEFPFAFEESGGDSYTLNYNPESATTYICANTAGSIFGSFASNDNNYHIINIEYDGTQTGNANRLKLFVDNVQKTLSFTGTVPASITLANGIGLGNQNISGGTSHTKVGEHVGYTPALASTPHQNIYNYLATEWGF